MISLDHVFYWYLPAYTSKIFCIVHSYILGYILVYRNKEVVNFLCSISRSIQKFFSCKFSELQFEHKLLIKFINFKIKALNAQVCCAFSNVPQNRQPFP